jgi:hypothetical protein
VAGLVGGGADVGGVVVAVGEVPVRCCGCPFEISAESTLLNGPRTLAAEVMRPSSRLWSRLEVEKFSEPANAFVLSTSMTLAWMYRAEDVSG